MKLYFDTNIYDFISDKEEDKPVYDFLHKNKLEIEASSTNVMETYAIPDRDRCKQQLKTLTMVATSFEKKPESWWQAQEVLSEIKRVNPHWLRQQPAQRLVVVEKEFLRANQKIWADACTQFIPHSSETLLFHKDFESGVKKSTYAQKALRQRLIENKLDLALASQKNGKIIDALEDKFLEPDLFWRADCLMVWFEAIARKMPESRDYADWLLPYIRDNAFNAPTYLDFWINRVKGEKVRKNRISSLVSFFQMKQKVTHGNSNDQLHACHIFDVDVFLTADKAFYKILESILPYFTNTARIVLIDRRASSAFDEIAQVVE